MEFAGPLVRCGVGRHIVTPLQSLACRSRPALAAGMRRWTSAAIREMPSRSTIIGPKSPATPKPKEGIAVPTCAVDLQHQLHTRPTYLDNAATTPMDPRVLDKMLPLMLSLYGNPHSRTHMFGWEAEEMVEDARQKIGRLIRASRPKREIIFTSGATESNNLAVKGIGSFYHKSGKRHAIATQLEHKCVLASMQWLEENLGWEVTYLSVGKDGIVDVKEIEAAIRPDTALVSIMLVNNEIGVRQPVEEIGAMLKKYPGVFLHSDAAQAVGKILLDVGSLGVDLLSISGHKIYGPKGIGALYVNSQCRPRLRLSPIISGGGQERGFRSGTLPTPLIVGFGAAAEIAEQELESDHRHVSRLADKLLNGITSQLSDVYLNGSLKKRYPGSVNLSFSCVEGESLIMSLADVLAVSSGSACTSASLEPSYVLRAIGVGEDLAHTSLRFGIGRFTTEEEVDNCIDAVVANVESLRELSPLWEMQQLGIEAEMEWT